PDYKLLIAFLRAMEFTALTRRVAEFAAIDAAEIEPDAKLKAGGAPRSERQSTTPAPQPVAPMLPLKGGGMKVAPREQAPSANEACYVPLAHRQGGDAGNGSLFAGPLAPDQLEEGVALAALKPLFERPGVLKIGHDLKFDLQLMALRGIEFAPYDDTMLMSYV